MFSILTHKVVHMSDSQVKINPVDAAKQDVASYGGSLESMVFADYINEHNESATRAFQWARPTSRIEFDRFISWCIKNKRVVRVVPFALYE